MDDARIVRGVCRCGHERRELVQADAAANVFELAALLELVGERDRVDRLTLRVEREGGAVHLRVRLAVEVGSIDDLADGADRTRRDHHRAEDTLFSLEVLRRNGRVRRDGGELGH